MKKNQTNNGNSRKKKTKAMKKKHKLMNSVISSLKNKISI